MEVYPDNVVVTTRGEEQEISFVTISVSPESGNMKMGM